MLKLSIVSRLPGGGGLRGFGKFMGLKKIREEHWEEQDMKMKGKRRKKRERKCFFFKDVEKSFKSKC